MSTKAQLYQSQVAWRKGKDLNAKRIATRGENLAVEYLESLSYKVLARNFRAGRTGEIDIIARSSDDVLAFVEVKTRSVDGVVYGIPELGFEAVGYRKQRKILSVSSAFIRKMELRGISWRYDVIVISIPRDPQEKIEIAHVENAFV